MTPLQPLTVESFPDLQPGDSPQNPPFVAVTRANVDFLARSLITVVAALNALAVDLAELKAAAVPTADKKPDAAGATDGDKKPKK